MDSGYFYLPDRYNTPRDYEYPSAEVLKTDTQHPEANSYAYFLEVQKYQPPKDFLPVFSLIECTEKLFVVGTNDFSSRVFDGNIIGADSFDVIVKKAIGETKFLSQELTTITGLKFLDSSMFLATLKSCEMKLYMRHPDENQPGLLTCAQRNSDGFIKNIDSFKDKQLVYGTSKGHIALVNYEMTDLSPILFYSHAHSADVTGISGCPNSTDTFVSCSLDRSCLLWDTKKMRPASGLLSKYENQLTAVRWTTQDENKEMIMVGDDAGNIITLDPRCPNKILNKTRVSNRPITSINFNGTNQFGVVSESNVMSIIEVDTDGGLKEVYKHTTDGIIYSMCWDARDEKTFYIVGEKKFAEKIVLN